MPREFPIRERACQQCDATYTSASGFQKFCSSDCRHAASVVDKVCPECGETFQRAGWTRTRFCSPKCANKSTAQARSGQRGQFGNGTSRARFPRPAPCRHCGESYSQKDIKLKFCSRRCAMLYRHARARAAAPKKWGLKWKGEEACRNCGALASHLHHIVPRSKSREGRENVDENGLPLCRDCHYGWHHRTTVIHHERMTDAEFAFAIRVGGEYWVECNYPDLPNVAALRREQIAGTLPPNVALLKESFDVRVTRVRGERPLYSR